MNSNFIQIDITWFPFDDQVCRFKFSSWTYTMDRVNLTLEYDAGLLYDFIQNGVSYI